MHKKPAIQLYGVTADAPRPLRLVHDRAQAEAADAARVGVRARCGLCGLRERAEIRTTPLSAGLAGVVTCHQLECGHGWHRTIANVGSIFPGLVRNATFVPCDCPQDVREGR